MQALDGPLDVRARAALFAGCDVVLHCNGNMDEMKLVATEAKALDGIPLRRAQAALAHLLRAEGSGQDSFDPAAA
jgi:beta-N-acetylhexosaminidase